MAPQLDVQAPLSPKSSDLNDHCLVNSPSKLGAAASHQPASSHNASCEHSKESDNLLVVSPYTERGHLLDLSTLDKPDQLLARALVEMTPIRDDYATAPYIDAFNWDHIIETLRGLAAAENYDWQHHLFYIVVFRSQLPPTTDRVQLGLMDEKVHVEATKNGGLLKYWFGEPDPVTARNLATCIWRGRGDAKQGSTLDLHQQAASCTRDLYTEWHIERLALVVGDGIKTWDMVDWESLHALPS